MNAKGKRIGVLARLRDLLPGQYSIGLTGRGPGGAGLAPGRYMVEPEGLGIWAEVEITGLEALWVSFRRKTEPIGPNEVRRRRLAPGSQAGTLPAARAARAAAAGWSLQEYLWHELVDLAGRPDTRALVARVRDRKAAIPTQIDADVILEHLEDDRR